MADFSPVLRRGPGPVAPQFHGQITGSEVLLAREIFRSLVEEYPEIAKYSRLPAPRPMSHYNTAPGITSVDVILMANFLKEKSKPCRAVEAAASGSKFP